MSDRPGGGAIFTLTLPARKGRGMSASVLVVDDERNIRRTLQLILTGEGHRVEEAASGEEALARLAQGGIDLVILDVRLPGRDGLDVLGEIARSWRGLPVLMVSGHASVSLAVEATRGGAVDFLEKPLSKDRVLLAVRNALRLSTLGRTVRGYEERAARERLLVGRHATMTAVRELIARVAPSQATVLITGESGTGKELVAHAIHSGSTRADRPFIKVNCAAIPEDLIEAELFGSVKGAFTGAERTRDGRFTLADGGTLFLDEVGDMSSKLQAKVLRALQEGEIERVGDTVTQKVDVRVIAATNKDLLAEARAGRFREDLFYRLNVVPIEVPPLRARIEDLPMLVEHFLALAHEPGERPARGIEAAAIEALGRHSWPGNVRELKNAIERLLILARGPVISAEDVARLVATSGVAANTPAESESGELTPESIRDQGGLLEARRRFETRCIEACLDRSRGNVSEAARWLGLERSNLHKKMIALGLEARPQRPLRSEDDDER
ncbi:MAG: sigma-54 dependent transcriptional regulator [Candidatus Eisenbacteria bacterium]